jgi:two-component system OmpR family response regulator
MSQGHPDIPLSVLVVDDLFDVAASVVEVLSMSGFSRVSVAHTGGAALELAADNPPDVVLLDIGLPDLNGWEVARWLREQGRATGKRALVIAVTGYGSAADQSRSEEAGVDLHLVKPVEPAVLVGVLKRFARVLV